MVGLRASLSEQTTDEIVGEVTEGSNDCHSFTIRKTSDGTR